jgi:cytoskeleton protein RodZ
MCMTEIIDSSSAPQSAAVSAGATLKARRIELGYTLDKVASQLKLTHRQIDAIENERFDELPGNTFVRGFVRNYARLLDLPWPPLQAYLEACLPVERQQAALPRVNEETAVPFMGGGKANTWLLGLVVLIGLAGGVGGVMWYLQQPAQPELLASAPAVVLPQLVVVDTASEVAAASQVASAVGAKMPVLASEPVAKIVASVPAAKSASTVLAPATAGDLSITVQKDSWVQVQDAAGAKLISELLKPGVEKSVSGVPPYRFKIGNAPHTQLIYRNQAVDLTSYTRGDVATFELK